MTPKIWNAWIPKFETLPAVNQVECNPFFQQRELRGLLEQSNVKIEAYRPLGHGALPCFLIPSSRKLQKNTKKMPAR